MQRVDLACRLSSRHVLVLVLQLEDETDVAEVTAGLKCHQVVRRKLTVRHVYNALLYEVDARGDHLESQQRRVVDVALLVAQRRNDLGDQLVVGLEAELGVHEEHVELLLETLEQMVLHELDLDLARQVIVTIVLRKERIGTRPEVLARVIFPRVDRLAVDALLVG